MDYTVATKPIAILKAGEAYPSMVETQGDYEDWIRAAIGAAASAVKVVDARTADPLPESNQFAGAVITGSHAMVTDREPWSETLKQWTVRAVRDGLPILGICYGHQLLAHALGGEVEQRPQGVEIGTVTVACTERANVDPLFADVPERFLAQTVHWQSVTRLPDGAVRLARSDADQNHAFRYGENAWGVQFHPEYSAEIMGAYVDVLAKQLTKQGLDAVELRRLVKPSTEAPSILSAFARYATSQLLSGR
ncbi:MAG: aminotransferase [Parvibaculum sp.]|uniref:glutamine amidotransferase n=1 Tax=Parvibaculum sp. TaxID=2024848 RepID=UPI0035BA6ACE